MSEVLGKVPGRRARRQRHAFRAALPTLREALGALRPLPRASPLPREGRPERRAPPGTSRGMGGCGCFTFHPGGWEVQGVGTWGLRDLLQAVGFHLFTHKLPFFEVKAHEGQSFLDPGGKWRAQVQG